MLRFKTGLTIFILFVILSLSVAIGAVELSVLVQEAYDNIATLPSYKTEVYQRLLENYNDVFMAFFLAREESSKLLLADPDVIVAHHRHVLNLWESNKDNYSLPFFLSYIAKITVTDERITPYRDVFRYWGLYELLDDYPSKEELVRGLNLWCRRYMTFQPTSGRDLAPVDIIEKTNLGRCEEMQIFFIAAARSLGIPARPASTRFWAHTDNNHAWVEVFVEGRWRYLGAVEPEYDLDEAWFSANVAKAILITASAAYPDSSDIVLNNDRYQSTINSTPNYFDNDLGIRQLIINVVNDIGDSVSDAEIAVNVYNWGMIRPIHRAKADEKGEYRIKTGMGSYLLSAYKDGLFAITVVQAEKTDVELTPSSSVVNITLQLDEIAKLSPLTAELHYRDRKIVRNTPTEDWIKRREGVVEDYNTIVADYLNRDFPVTEADSLLNEVWRKCRNNQEQFYQFFSEYCPLTPDFLRILTLIDEKFLWQADSNQFSNLYHFYLDSDDLDYPDDVKAHLFSPTSLFEELPEQSLSEDFLLWREGDIEQRVDQIISFMKERYVIDNEKSVQSLLSVDKMTALEFLTSYQYKMLACGLLKANFIPAVYSRIPDVIVIYNEDWQYYNLNEKSFETRNAPVVAEDTSAKSGFSLDIVDEHDYPLILDNSQISLTKLHEGVFYSTQEKPLYNEQSVLEVDLEPDVYFLHLGFRPSSDLSIVHLEVLDIGENERIERRIQLHNYPRKWNDAPPELALLIEQILAVSHLQPSFIVFGDFDREPIRRVAEHLANRAESDSYLWVGVNHSPDAPEYYQVSDQYRSWLHDNPIYQQRTITIAIDQEQGVFTFFDGFWESLPLE